LAPVAEAADAEAAAFLGTRSYGKDEDLVAAAVAAFVRGMRRGGVLCVVKHFPGNAAADPHRAAAVIRSAGGRLDGMTALFARVLDEGAIDAVMASHAVAEAVDPKRPSSLSPLVVDGLLRGRLGFSGLVVCDDLRMGAVAATGRNAVAAAVEAVAAGCDLVMTWPSDAPSMRDALVAAEASGLLRAGRIREAARRVVEAKLKAGLRPGVAFSPIEERTAELRAETARVLAEAGLR
jgi:beta-N-acetylhexosaminidase